MTAQIISTNAAMKWPDFWHSNV